MDTDLTNEQIREVFRQALEKGYLNWGFMTLVAEALCSGTTGPLTLEEFSILTNNIRQVLKKEWPGEAMSYKGCTTVEIVVQLAALFLYDG